MRRRRRNRGTWFPTLGNQFTEEGVEPYTQAGWNLSSFHINTKLVEGPIQDIFPVTKDYTIEPSNKYGTTEHSLRDYVGGQDWLLQRLVGKLHIRVASGSNEAQNDQNYFWPFVRVAAGFFVARSDDESQGPDLYDYEFDPFALDNIQNPWIWRRTWILRNPRFAANDYPVAGYDFPVSNMFVPGTFDGPHIDSKVKRRVRREERLWFTYAGIGWNGTQTQVIGESVKQPTVAGHLDLRIFGSLRAPGKQSQF